jgi:hypothetical protein
VADPKVNPEKKRKRKPEKPGEPEEPQRGRAFAKTVAIPELQGDGGILAPRRKKKDPCAKTAAIPSLANEAMGDEMARLERELGEAGRTATVVGHYSFSAGRGWGSLRPRWLIFLSVAAACLAAFALVRIFAGS